MLLLLVSHWIVFGSKPTCFCSTWRKGEFDSKWTIREDNRSMSFLHCISYLMLYKNFPKNLVTGNHTNVFSWVYFFQVRNFDTLRCNLWEAVVKMSDLSWGVSLECSTGEGSNSKLIQIVGRIHFAVAFRIRVVFSCWLSAEGYRKLLKGARNSLPNRIF